eukprot:TRINITY_DN3110_c0_g1_i4.p1 TRINITY_DN3110_c0_g1~~TRINITY_DN3110_c0_g1_i4.p1  ORF type:complete len:1902 (+),score=470.86 TRINITY_DN3110_c0_g1_i4:351-5708(+)
MEVTVSLYCAILLNTNIVLSLFDSASVFVPSRDSAGIPDETSVQFVQMKTFDFVEVFVLMQGFEMNLKHSLISREALELFETENKLLINLHTSYLFNSLSANVSYFIFEGSILPKFDFSLIDHFHVFSIPNYPCIIQVNAHISDSVVSGMKIKVSEGTINSLPGHIIVDVLQILYDSPDRDNFHSVTTTLMSPEWVNPGLYWITHSGGTDFWQANIKGNSKRLYYPNIYYYDETIATGCFRLSFVDDLEDFANKNYLHSVNIISNGNTYVLRNPPSPVASPIFAVICKDNFGLFSTIDSRIWLYPTQFGDYQIITESYFSMHTFPSYLKIFRGNEPKNITDEMIGKGYNYYTGTQTFSDVSSVNFVKFYLNYTDSLYYSITILPEDSSNLNMCLNGYKNERLEISHCNFGQRNLGTVEFVLNKDMNITHFEIAGHFEILIQDLDSETFDSLLESSSFNSSCSWDDMIDNIDNSLGLDPCDVVDVTDQTSLSMMTLQRIFKIVEDKVTKYIQFAVPGLYSDQRNVSIFFSAYRMGTIVITSAEGCQQMKLFGKSKLDVTLPFHVEFTIDPLDEHASSFEATFYVGIANQIDYMDSQSTYLGSWFDIPNKWSEFFMPKQNFDAFLTISAFGALEEFPLMSEDIQMMVNISNKAILQLPDSTIILLLSSQPRHLSFLSYGYLTEVSYWSLTRLNDEEEELENLPWHMINSLDDLQQKSFYIDEKETFPYVQKLMTSSQTMFKYCDIDKGTKAMKCASLLMVFPETCDITLAGSIRRTNFAIAFSTALPFIAITSKTPCKGIRVTTNLINKDLFFSETKAKRLYDDDSFGDADSYAMLDLSTVSPTSIYIKVSDYVEKILSITVDSDIVCLTFQLIQVGCSKSSVVESEGFTCFRHIFDYVGKSGEKREIIPIRLSQGLYRLTFSKGVIKNIQLHFYDLDSSYVLPDLKTYCPGGIIINDSCSGFDGLLTDLSSFVSDYEMYNSIVVKYLDGTFKEIFVLNKTFDYHLISKTMLDITLFVDDWYEKGDDHSITLIDKDGIIYYKFLEGKKFSFILRDNEVIEIPSNSIITRVFVQPGNSEYVKDDLTGQMVVPFSRKILTAVRCYLNEVDYCLNETNVNSLFEFHSFNIIDSKKLEYINLNQRQATTTTLNNVYEMFIDSFYSKCKNTIYLLNSIFIKLNPLKSFNYYANPAANHVSMYSLTANSLRYSRINLNPLPELKGDIFIILKIEEQYFKTNEKYQFVVLPSIDTFLEKEGFNEKKTILFSINKDDNQKQLFFEQNMVYHIIFKNVLNLCLMNFEELKISLDSQGIYVKNGKKNISVEDSCDTFATFSMEISPTNISLIDVKNDTQKLTEYYQAFELIDYTPYISTIEAKLIFLQRTVSKTSNFIGKHYDLMTFILPKNVFFEVEYFSSYFNNTAFLLPYNEFKYIEFIPNEEKLLNTPNFSDPNFQNLQIVLKSNVTTPKCIVKILQNNHYIYSFSQHLNPIWLIYNGKNINVTLISDDINLKKIYLETFPSPFKNFYDSFDLDGQTNYFSKVLEGDTVNKKDITKNLTVFSLTESVSSKLYLAENKNHYWMISICNLDSFIVVDGNKEPITVFIKLKKRFEDLENLFIQDTTYLKENQCVNFLIDPQFSVFDETDFIWLFFYSNNLTTVKIQLINERSSFKTFDDHYIFNETLDDKNFKYFCKFGQNFNHIDAHCPVSTSVRNTRTLLENIFIFGAVFVAFMLILFFIFYLCKKKTDESDEWIDIENKGNFILSNENYINSTDDFYQYDPIQQDDDSITFLQ